MSNKEIKAGIILKDKFWTPTSKINLKNKNETVISNYAAFIDYIDKEISRNAESGKNHYLSYMNNPFKTSGLFKHKITAAFFGQIYLVLIMNI